MFQFVQDELGDVGAADRVPDADLQARLGAEPAGGGAVGQPGRPDDSPVQVAGGDQGLLAFLVGELGPQAQRDEDALEREAGTAPAVPHAVAGYPDQPGDPGGLHRVDDAGHARVQVLAGR